MNNSTTISAKELKTIEQNALLHGSHTQPSKKQILHEMSQNRAAKWNNTIEALRRKKIEDKIKKQQQEEALLRALDEKEEKLREENRQQMIKRANLAKQEQSDQIRQFKSKLMMADIVHQRQQQIKIKQFQKEMEKTQNKKYLQQTLNTMQQFDEKENTKKIIQKQKQFETQTIITTQLIEVEKRKLKEKLLRDEEAKYLIQIAKEEEQKAIKREKQRLQHIEKIQKEQVLWLNEQIKQKEGLSKRDECENAQIKKYAMEKERIENIRKSKEQKRFEERQEIRQKLIDSQTKYLENLATNEDARVAKQVEEAEKKLEEFEKLKIAKQKELLQQCLDRCEQQNERKKMLKDIELKEDKRRLKEIDQDVTRYKEEERMNVVTRRKDAIEVQSYLRKQIINKKRREIKWMEKDKMYQDKIIKEYKEEQYQISEWAKQKINEYEAMGLNVKHLFK
eukprot:429636_1